MGLGVGGLVEEVWVVWLQFAKKVWGGGEQSGKNISAPGFFPQQAPSLLQTGCGTGKGGGGGGWACGWGSLPIMCTFAIQNRYTSLHPFTTTFRAGGFEAG